MAVSVVVCVGNTDAGGAALITTDGNGFTNKVAGFEVTTVHNPFNITRKVLVFWLYATFGRDKEALFVPVFTQAVPFHCCHW